MEALAEYRATRGKPPVSPWARGRLCTAYMKRKTQEAYIRAQGVVHYDCLVGLRADEPDRVASLVKYDTRLKTNRSPLYDAGITKPDVLEFWRAQPFDLGVSEIQGNCTGCFLKDYGDLARVLGEPETDAAWWIALQEQYVNFGGRRFPGYRQLLSERAMRLELEAHMRRMGVEDLRAKKISIPALLKALSNVRPADMTEPKFRLVVVQEKKRLCGEVPAFVCHCEESGGVPDDEDELDALLDTVSP